MKTFLAVLKLKYVSPQYGVDLKTEFFKLYDKNLFLSGTESVRLGLSLDEIWVGLDFKVSRSLEREMTGWIKGFVAAQELYHGK